MGSWTTFDKLVWKRPKPTYIYQSQEKAWVGWDTETCQGDIGLVCMEPQPPSKMNDHVRSHIEDDYGKGGMASWHKWQPEDVVNSGEILNKMYHPGYHGVWYNLKYDIECILKQLPVNIVRRILLGQEVNFKGYNIHYIPGKKFTIKRGNISAHHFDFAQFYHTSLDNAARTYLDDKKTLESVSRSELGQSWDVWHDHKEELIRYCYHDASLTRRLAELWYDWADSFGIDASYPISPANVAGRHALQRGVPKYSKNLHENVGEPAWKSYYGGRFEARMKGWFDQLYSIDIKSAYPAIMVDLPSTSCQWVRTHNEKKALGYPWGFVQAEIKVDEEADWSPVMHRKSDGLVFGPVGYLGKKWITLDEYLCCINHDHTNVSFVKAWVGEDNGERPFAWIKDVYERRAELKEAGDLREFILKIIMNSVYGKTLQRNPSTTVRQVEEYRGSNMHHDNIILIDGVPHKVEENTYEIGPLFNPMYASTITARVRCQLWEMMQKYDTAIVMTDGIMTTEPVDTNDLGSQLGDWELDAEGQGVIIGNGLYQIADKRSKRRGFNVPQRFDGWIDALEDCDPQATAITIPQRRPLHPGEVLIRDDYDMTDVGAFVDMVKAVRFNHDRKRDFPEVTASDLLTENYTGRCITL